MVCCLVTLNSTVNSATPAHAHQRRTFCNPALAPFAWQLQQHILPTGGSDPCTYALAVLHLTCVPSGKSLTNMHIHYLYMCATRTHYLNPPPDTWHTQPRHMVNSTADEPASSWHDLLVLP